LLAIKICRTKAFATLLAQNFQRLARSVVMVQNQPHRANGHQNQALQAQHQRKRILAHIGFQRLIENLCSDLVDLSNRQQKRVYLMGM